jgi:hypothetical protein
LSGRSGWAGAAAAAAWLGAAAPASAAPFSDAELQQLERGSVIHRNVDEEIGGQPYFGGVAYVIIDAPADAVMRALVDPRSYASILPLTLEARVVEQRGPLRFVWFKQGGRYGTASYTVMVRRESPRLVRFWLDPSRPHEIADCWGSFRVEDLPGGRSLLAWAALVRLDFGLVRVLFSERIRSFAMTTPELVKGYVERGAR